MKHPTNLAFKLTEQIEFSSSNEVKNYSRARSGECNS